VLQPKRDPEQTKSDETKNTSLHVASQHTHEPTNAVVVGITRSNHHIFLQVVTVSNVNGNTFALLDGGSQCTIITKSLCQTLNLPGRMEKMTIGTIKDKEVLPAKIVNLQITSKNSQFTANVKHVYSLDNKYFNVPSQNLPISADPNGITSRTLTFVVPDQIQMLIGADVPNALISNEVRKGPLGLPYASKTPLAWTLFGVYESLS